jgi:hypothetical protein
MRQFDSGATRNVDTDNLDMEGFISPLVMLRYSEYMHKHRKQADGKLRASDNWAKGIPLSSYMKSGFRHFHDWWMAHRGYVSREGLEEGICALLFNAMGYLHEVLKARGYKQQQCQGSQQSQAGGIQPCRQKSRSLVADAEQLSGPLEGTGCCGQTDGRV